MSELRSKHFEIEQPQSKLIEELGYRAEQVEDSKTSTIYYRAQEDSLYIAWKEVKGHTSRWFVGAVYREDLAELTISQRYDYIAERLDAVEELAVINKLGSLGCTSATEFRNNHRKQLSPPIHKNDSIVTRLIVRP